MTETGVVKACVSCGRNLNGQQRMKDSAARYWCMACGAEDQRRKRAAAAGADNACGGCGETYPGHLLSVWGSKRLCPKCSPGHRKGSGLTAAVTGVFAGLSSGGGDKKKLVMMLAVMILLAAIALYINFG